MSILRLTALLAVLVAHASAVSAQEEITEPADETPSVASALPGMPATQSPVAGLGVMSCQAASQRYSTNFRFYQSLGMDAETAYWTSFQGMLHWALGYMSHRNLALSQAGVQPVNLQPPGFDHALHNSRLVAAVERAAQSGERQTILSRETCDALAQTW